MKAVITVIGKDTVGVVAQVSAVCAELNINIEDVTQSIMQDMFCMIMLVNLSALQHRPGRRARPVRRLGRKDGHAGHPDPAGSL